MNHKRHILCLLLFIACGHPILTRAGEGCTTAVVTGQATIDGRPLLWKNRDTDNLSNKVVLVKDKPYTYLAVVNADDSSGRVAWGGLNEAGFAIINSVSYNLPKKGGESADLEGIVMADALRSCATVEDFEQYIRKNLGPELGCWTNFCVIDARGGASIIEVHNHGYARLDADTAAQHYLLNTNFSRSGVPDGGGGYLRYDRETELFKSASPRGLSHNFIFQTVARDLGHALLRNPARDTWSKLPADKPYWVHTNHTIDRNITACSILIQGVNKGEDPHRAILWIILGEPVCSIAIPLWVEAGETPADLRLGSAAPISAEAERLKHMMRPLPGNDREEYADLTKLDNAAGSGWLPTLLRVETEIFRQTEELAGGKPSPDELARFEQQMARKALQTLQGIR
jgi:hypothetical protein